MAVEIRRAREGDGEYIADRMRKSDQREIWLLAALTPRPAVRVTLAMSIVTLTATVDGRPAMMFGMCRKSAISEIGVPWLFGTSEVDEHQYSFRRSKEYFQRFQAAFPVMENHALAENVKSLRWLKWLGFDMEEPQPYGPFGASFVRFGRGLECA
jgi:hypothetical protein